MKQEAFETIRNHPKLSIIGHMTETAGERAMVTKNGQDVDEGSGWDGIKKK